MNEADGVLPFSPTGGVNTTLSDGFTLAYFHCPVAATANYSSQHGNPTWRYIYNRSFAETMPYPWVRPFHGSDLTLVLGDVRSAAYQDVGPEVQKAGQYLMDAIASFVRDPADGLTRVGWPRYDVSGKLRISPFRNRILDLQS
jgi:carboxylesterase type B